MGVLGSASNPPHLGHLVLAQEVRWQLGLEEVLLVPTGIAPHKRIEDDPGVQIRLQMARIAAADGATLSVSELETAREGPSFTYRTLELLSEERPDADLVLLMGADAAAGVESWKRPERIVELAHTAVAGRAGVERSLVESALERVGAGGESGRGYGFFEMPEIAISSSMIRERVRQGRPIRYLVPDGVVELIEARGLYGC